MNEIIRIGMDTSKHIFQLHGVDAQERPVLRKRLSRSAMLAFFGNLAPTIVVIEACGASHYWARELAKLGHEVKLIAPQLVKPYVTRNKNDGRDAEGLCEAGSREQLIVRRTQLGNMIRGHAAVWPRRHGQACIAADRPYEACWWWEQPLWSSWPRARRDAGRNG